ncbi:hypothetical protein Patl1_32983 [Pistacia atlantica]|uniref:Uncharacterized protein n=1 Tax=Pistacia atlantica TaxID=434234 RepID=A0ACC1AM78_9ROSI|nr:hypothetical protein Patl1_32983 [Pistacia atlantica]
MVFSVEAASDKEPKVRSHVASVLELLLQGRLIHPMYFSSIAEALLERVGDPDIDIRSAFVRLFSHVLPTMMYTCGLNDSGVCGTCRPGFLTLSNGSNLHWKQIFALKPLHWQLHSQQLVSVLSYISQRWKCLFLLGSSGSFIAVRVQKTTLRVKHEETGNIGVNDIWLDIKVGEDILERIFSVNNLAGAWWAIQDAARYCIATRLRTNLDFVEALKKDVYNAYEGSAVLPPATRQSSLFFRANKKVCEEWSLEILVASALKDKPRAQVTGNLHNLRSRYSGDILQVIQHMALALCKSHESEALFGLQKWVSMTFSSLLVDEHQSLNHSGAVGPFSWITGLIYQAEGQYEKAAVHFAHLLQTEESLSSMGSDGVQFAITRIIESYTAVSDWKSPEFWLLELQTLRAKHAGKSYSGALTTAGNEIDAIHALAHFDEGDFQASWTWPGSDTEK